MIPLDPVSLLALVCFVAAGVWFAVTRSWAMVLLTLGLLLSLI